LCPEMPVKTRGFLYVVEEWECILKLEKPTKLRTHKQTGKKWQNKQHTIKYWGE